MKLPMDPGVKPVEERIAGNLIRPPLALSLGEQEPRERPW